MQPLTTIWADSHHKATQDSKNICRYFLKLSSTDQPTNLYSSTKEYGLHNDTEELKSHTLGKLFILGKNQVRNEIT